MKKNVIIRAVSPYRKGAIAMLQMTCAGISGTVHIPQANVPTINSALSYRTLVNKEAVIDINKETKLATSLTLKG